MGGFTLAHGDGHKPRGEQWSEFWRPNSVVAIAPWLEVYSSDQAMERTMENFFVELEAPHPHCVKNIVFGGKLPKRGLRWEFVNELKPIDLYCYLYAKYGEPNGIQNFLRTDDSDNLIHWEWTLASERGIVSILGMNFRTEVHLIGDFVDSGLTLEMFISQIKSDLKNYGKKISAFRLELEKWTRFFNPYSRIKSSVEQNFKQLDMLDIDPRRDRLPHPGEGTDYDEFKYRWQALNERYSSAVGLVFGLRAMLPVLAESFVNLLIFVLARPEIKANDRLFQNVVRQPIDVRVQMLSVHCIGFSSVVDYASDECKAFHTLMNDRNDLLHGNIEIPKLAMGEVYFREKVPLFLQYEDMWSESIGASLRSIKFETIQQDRKVVEDFISYLVGRLAPKYAETIEHIASQRDLGMNIKTGRLGVLFSDQISDFRAVFKSDEP